MRVVDAGRKGFPADPAEAQPFGARRRAGHDPALDVRIDRDLGLAARAAENDDFGMGFEEGQVVLEQDAFGGLGRFRAGGRQDDDQDRRADAVSHGRLLRWCQAPIILQLNPGHNTRFPISRQANPSDLPTLPPLSLPAGPPKFGNSYCVPDFPPLSPPIPPPAPQKIGNGYHVPQFPPLGRHGPFGSYGGMGRSAHLLLRRPAYVVSVTTRTGTIMDTYRNPLEGGGENRSKQGHTEKDRGVILPRHSRGPAPAPAATRGGSLQSRKSRQAGSIARLKERENSPAGPSGVTVRDKEKS